MGFPTCVVLADKTKHIYDISVHLCNYISVSYSEGSPIMSSVGGCHDAIMSSVGGCHNAE